MQEKHSAANCRWATPTLFVAAPVWYLAEQFPWTCLRDAVPRPLASTEDCETCVRWEEGSGLTPGVHADGPALLD